MKIRQEIIRFAERMEMRLRENDYKGGWKEMDHSELIGRIMEEIEELEESLFGVCKECYHPFHIPHPTAYRSEEYDDPRDEAADIANFAMMIADNVENENKEKKGGD